MTGTGSDQGGAGALSRRGFLRASSGLLAGSMLPGAEAILTGGTRGRARSCIFLLLTGGPSHLETFDPKPDAPLEIRGPYGAIRTKVRGIRISETLPLTARVADKFTIIRSMCHDAAPVHETGLQLLQTGRLASDAGGLSHVGDVVARVTPARDGAARHVLLPGPLGRFGTGLPTSQEAFVRENAASAVESASARVSPQELEAYGDTAFGRHCLVTRRLVEQGVRFVTVNMFQAAMGVTWDAHGAFPFTDLRTSCEQVAPVFDRAFSSLLRDLDARGLLQTTLVVAAGEFGRSPRINRWGGRDHWPACWSVLVAGGGTRGGQVIGSSAPDGAYPQDRPVAPAELVATIYDCMGVDPGSIAGSGERSRSLVDSGFRPIRELV